MAGDVAFDSVRRITELVIGTTQADPSISLDGKELFFVSDDDLFLASRTSMAEPWTLVRRVDELNSASLDGRLSLAADGYAVFLSNRPPSMMMDIWSTMRGSDGVFAPPTQTEVVALNTANNDQNPDLSPDGITLWYSRAGGMIHRSTRPPGGSFAAATVVTELQVLFNAVDPTVSPDQLVAVFSASQTGILDLWYATRATVTDPFGNQMPVPEINTALTEVDGDLAANGCELYFSRGLDEMWVATLTP